MAWKQTVKEKYDSMKEDLFLAGGQRKIDLQHTRGKLTARERMEALFDGGVFNEIEMYSKSQVELEDVKKKHYLGDGVVCGYGQVVDETVDVFVYVPRTPDNYVRFFCGSQLLFRPGKR